jgi:hypothetical protein
MVLLHGFQFTFVLLTSIQLITLSFLIHIVILLGQCAHNLKTWSSVALIFCELNTTYQHQDVSNKHVGCLDTSSWPVDFILLVLIFEKRSFSSHNFYFALQCRMWWPKVNVPFFCERNVWFFVFVTKRCSFFLLSSWATVSRDFRLSVFFYVKRYPWVPDSWTKAVLI